MTIWQAAMLFRDEKELGGTVSMSPEEAKAAIAAAKERKANRMQRFGDPLPEPEKPRRRRRRRR